MCETCDFCGNSGLDSCIVCGRCYCIDHMGGDGYCIDCFFGSGLFEWLILIKRIIIWDVYWIKKIELLNNFFNGLKAYLFREL